MPPTTIEYGADTTEQSSLNFLYLLAFQPSPKGFAIFGVSDERYHIARRQPAPAGRDRGHASGRPHSAGA